MMTPEDTCSSQNKSWYCDSRKQVVPVWISLFDQPNLPGAVPFLELLFSPYSCLDVIEDSIIDQSVDIVLPRESWYDLRSVLINPSHEIVGHADIKRATDAAGQDVDVVGAPHGRSLRLRLSHMVVARVDH